MKEKRSRYSQKRTQGDKKSQTGGRGGNVEREPAMRSPYEKKNSESECTGSCSISWKPIPVSS